MRVVRVLTPLVIVTLLLVGCGDDDTAPTQPDGETDDTLFPDVIAAVATRGADGTMSFDVTISSPYDSPDRYADAFRVLGPDGAELGLRELTHDHASEQPFTRSLDGIDVGGAVDVTIEARDSVNGWGGTTRSVDVPSS